MIIKLKRRSLVARLIRSFTDYRNRLGIYGSMRNAWYINKAH